MAFNNKPSGKGKQTNATVGVAEDLASRKESMKKPVMKMKEMKKAVKKSTKKTSK